MRRAVTYTHQAGAGGSNTIPPPQKKILVIFGPPLVYMPHLKAVLVGFAWKYVASIVLVYVILSKSATILQTATVIFSLSDTCEYLFP